MLLPTVQAQSFADLFLHHLALFIYSKSGSVLCPSMLPEADTTYMELLDLKPLPVTALANGTYEELYRYIHFNPIQTKTPGHDELSRLGEKMVHSSEGKRALARKVQPLLAHLPGSSGDATFDAAASGPNLSYGDSRSNCLSRRNSDPFHNGDINPGADEHPSICHLLLHHLHLFIYSKVYLTITLEKMAKGDAQKLYFTALTTYIELLDLKPLLVTALANGTYEELYRYIHFNPIQTKTPGHDELSRLGEKMVHSSEGKRALARVLCHELHDNAQSMERIEELLQEDQNVKRRKERIRKQSSILSKLTTQLCINDNLAAAASTYSNEGDLFYDYKSVYSYKFKVQPLLAHLPGSSGDATFDAAASGPNLSYGDSRSNCLSRRNSDPFHNGDINPGADEHPSICHLLLHHLHLFIYSKVYLTITLEKMAKGDAQKLYFTALTTYMELLDLKPLLVTALANGTYQELYRYIHFNPIQTKTPGHDELSRLGEKMVHSSEGKRALARVLCHELHDNAQSMERIEELLQEDQNVKRRKERIQKQSSILSKLTTQLCINDNLAAAASTYSNKKVQPLLAHLPGSSGDATFDAAASGPNLSYGDSRSNCLSRRNSDPFHNGDINPGADEHPSICHLLLHHLHLFIYSKVYLTITLEKMAKGDAQKLYFTALTTYMEFLDLKPLLVTALANGTYEELYRYIHFNPIQTKTPGHDELSRLGEKMVHSSEGKRALARVLCHELHDNAQSMERIEELLQEDQNVKRRKERIQKQSSILSKLTTQLCINDNLAAAASTYSNEGDLFYDYKSVYSYKFKVQPLLAHLPGSSGDAKFDAAASGPNLSYGDSRSNCLSRRNSDPFHNGDINPGADEHPSICHLLLHHLHLFIYSKVYLTITLEKMAKGDAQKLYFTALTTYMELLDLKPLLVTALANGTYEELYRYIHFNPIQTKKVQPLLAHLPGSSGDATFDAAASGPNLSYGDSRSNCLSRRNSDPFHNGDINPGADEHPSICHLLLHHLHLFIYSKVYLTITLEKMAKGDAQKLYFTAPTTYMELLDLKPLLVTALANGTYQELYRYIHFNPIQTKTPGQDELSRLGEKMVHSSEGKRALARVLCHELHDKFLQHGLAQSMERIEELLQEDQNVKRRKERIQKQSSILSKLTTQLCINDNLAAAASTYSNEGDLFYDYKSVYSYKFKVQPLLAHLPGSSGDATFDAAASGPNLSYGDSRSNCLSRRNSDPFHNGDINPGADEHPSICHLLLHHLHLFIYSKVYLTITLEKMAKGDAQKLYFTVPIFEPHPP
ncbi:hypothetical protein SASPL_133408 [Salvia splendens]|uniref:Dynamin GTPase n=1 Tax=Salvia splendens TaxID=180675 RepID=A0A8X8X453_SALSN|nr:hypothetical protein SASPL_133408 [Salvia splendens]